MTPEQRRAEIERLRKSVEDWTNDLREIEAEWDSCTETLGELEEQLDALEAEESNDLD